MRLQLTGATDIAASQGQVWTHLMNPAFVAASAPGVESVETIDPTHFRVISSVGAGALKLTVTMHVALEEIVEPERTRVRVHGRALGSAGQVVVAIQIDERSPGRVRLHWHAGGEVNGAIASLGVRMLEGTVKRRTEQFWADFARRVETAAGRSGSA